MSFEECEEAAGDGRPASTPRRREKKQSILRAASRLFRENGVHVTGIRDIADSLGISTGCIYTYFPTKEALIAYCQEHAMARLLRLAEEVRAAPDLGARGKLLLMIQGHVELLNGEDAGSQAQLELDMIHPEERHAYERHLRELLQEGVADGTLRADLDVKLAAMGILGALNWTVRWFRPEGEMAAAEIGAEFASLVLRGVLSAENEESPEKAGEESGIALAAVHHTAKSRTASSRI